MATASHGADRRPNWSTEMIPETLPTFAELTALSFELALLRRNASKLYRPRANRQKTLRIWYLTLKPALIELVGWRCEDRQSVLCTSFAYDVAYNEILRALDGKGCPWMVERSKANLERRQAERLHDELAARGLV